MSNTLTQRLHLLRAARGPAPLSIDDDPRENPDRQFGAEFSAVNEAACLRTRGHITLTCCGVTRCLFCATVLA